MRVFLASLLAALSITVIGSSSSQAKATCVMPGEWQQVDYGWTMKRVHNLFDFKGYQYSKTEYTQLRKYRKCSNPDTFYYIGYNQLHNWNKWRVFYMNG